MSADEVLEFFASGTYRGLLSLLVTASLVFMVLLVYFTIAKSPKRSLEVDRGAAPWNFLIATILNSFLITLLNTAESISYSASNFAREAATFADSPFALVPYLSGIFAVFVQFGIALIAIRRVIALDQWLRRNEAG